MAASVKLRSVSGVRRLSVREVAEHASVSRDLVLRAIHTTDPASFPPPLPAHRLGDSLRAPYRVREDDAFAWEQLIEDRYPV